MNMSINITKNTSYNKINYCPNRKIKYIVIHYTAGSTSRAGAAINGTDWWANSPYEGSAEFMVDDKTIVQYSPDIDNYLTWHCGDGYNGSTGGGKYYGVCTNSNSIGIEICSNNDNYSANDPWNSPKWYFTDVEINNAVELTKYLMQRYKIDVDHVIRHYDVSGKVCPGVLGWNTHAGSNENKWLDFKKRISGITATAANSSTTASTATFYRVQCGAFSIKKNAEAFLNALKSKGFSDAFVVAGKTNLSETIYRVQCGAFKEKANAEAFKNKLQGSGAKDAFVVASKATANATTAKKTVNELAREVIAGKWGVGSDRKSRLIAAGYDYTAIQAEVNRIMG